MTHTGRANGIHYVIQGSGPWITLSHALGCDHTMWDPQVTALVDAGYRVLRFDTRGHGRSDAPPGPYTLEQLADDLLGLLQQLVVGSTHFVGLSMGGMIGQSFALKYPGILQSLVLCDTSSRYAAAARPMWHERLRVAQAAGMEALVEPTLGRWFTAPFREAHPDRIAPIAKTIRGTPVRGYVGCAQAILEMDLTARLKEIQVPSLVMVGEDDTGTPVSMAHEIRDNLPGSELAIIPRAAHLSNVEQPERFNAVLLGFLNRLER